MACETWPWLYKASLLRVEQWLLLLYPILPKSCKLLRFSIFGPHLRTLDVDFYLLFDHYLLLISIHQSEVFVRRQVRILYNVLSAPRTLIFPTLFCYKPLSKLHAWLGRPPGRTADHQKSCWRIHFFVGLSL
jgi:hypothetical protein